MLSFWVRLCRYYYCRVSLMRRVKRCEYDEWRAKRDPTDPLNNTNNNNNNPNEWIFYSPKSLNRKPTSSRRTVSLQCVLLTEACKTVTKQEGFQYGNSHYQHSPLKIEECLKNTHTHIRESEHHFEWVR